MLADLGSSVDLCVLFIIQCLGIAFYFGITVKAVELALLGNLSL